MERFQPRARPRRSAASRSRASLTRLSASAARALFSDHRRRSRACGTNAIPLQLPHRLCLLRLPPYPCGLLCCEAPHGAEAPGARILPLLGPVLLPVAVGSTVVVGPRNAFFKIELWLGPHESVVGVMPVRVTRTGEKAASSKHTQL